MAQPTSLPEVPQDEAARAAHPSSSAPPASPTKSLWKRLLNRGANAQPESPTKNFFPENTAPTTTASPATAPASWSPQAPEAASKPLSHHDGVISGAPDAADDNATTSKPPASSRRPHRDVVPGLPRAQTFARQQSELRDNLLRVKPTPAERRAVSGDRRLTRSVSSPTGSQVLSSPRSSLPNISHPPRTSGRMINRESVDAMAPTQRAPPPLFSSGLLASGDHSPISEREEEKAITATASGTSNDENLRDTVSAILERAHRIDESHDHDDKTSCHPDKSVESFLIDTSSMTSSQYEHRIRYELEHVWILNLSMHFRDKSRREKFFVTYRERPDLSRRVTVSLDYRDAPEGSLEMDLLETKLQRDKNEMIYEAIRESLVDIQFYNTVTNLKLQTTDGRLHVHVVEDVNEVIEYPSSRFVQHLSCRKVLERDVEFDSHMSGFVYKVRVDDQLLIKKEIPGPDTVEEFLYEVNALNSLRDSHNVIQLYGVVMGDDSRVKGLLISYAEQGALIDILYDSNHGISWYTRMKWARQIILGLSEIHEAGFVQGDFTLSNIVIDDDGNAKIIDINRRGCPIGWEPPEATPLIRSDQRISMYIGVKSDLYQLGMVLWALATQEDDPEAHGRPLHLDGDVDVPHWYRTIAETCLAENPRVRAQARQLLAFFPSLDDESGQLDDSDYDAEWIDESHNPSFYAHSAPSASFDDGSDSYRHRARAGSAASSDGNNTGIPPINDIDHLARKLAPRIRTVTPRNDWAYVNFGHTYVDPSNGVSNEPYYYPVRGRSPPGASKTGLTQEVNLPNAAVTTRRSSETESPGGSQKKNEVPSRAMSQRSIRTENDSGEVTNPTETEASEPQILPDNKTGSQEPVVVPVSDEAASKAEPPASEVLRQEMEIKCAGIKEVAV